MAEKYIVFKIDDWLDAWKGMDPDPDTEAEEGSHPLSELQGKRLPGAHVIREQDIFAAPVLYAYASAVQTTIEIMHREGIDVPVYLETARDHFFEAAGDAEASPVKRLPDA